MTDETTQALLPVMPEDFTLAARHFGDPPDITREDIRYWDGGLKLAEVEERARDYARHRLAHSRPSQADAGDVGTTLRALNIMNAILDLPFANTAPIEWDDADWHHVRRALAALTPTSGEEMRLREALAGFGDDFMTSEQHHPGYVLIPSEQFERIRAALTEGAE